MNECCRSALLAAADELNDRTAVPWMCPDHECDADLVDWLLARAAGAQPAEVTHEFVPMEGSDLACDHPLNIYGTPCNRPQRDPVHHPVAAQPAEREYAVHSCVCGHHAVAHLDDRQCIALGGCDCKAYTQRVAAQNGDQ